MSRTYIQITSTYFLWKYPKDFLVKYVFWEKQTKGNRKFHWRTKVRQNFHIYAAEIQMIIRQYENIKQKTSLMPSCYPVESLESYACVSNADQEVYWLCILHFLFQKVKFHVIELNLRLS